MANKLTIKQVAENEGLSIEELLENATFDSVCPSCCDECGEVEPDGHCEHGFPSVLLEAGLI